MRRHEKMVENVCCWIWHVIAWVASDKHLRWLVIFAGVLVFFIGFYVHCRLMPEPAEFRTDYGIVKKGDPGYAQIVSSSQKEVTKLLVTLPLVLSAI